MIEQENMTREKQTNNKINEFCTGLTIKRQ